MVMSAEDALPPENSIDYSAVTIPDLVPAGSGSDAGAQKKFTLRGRQSIFIYADEGEDLTFALAQEAGDDRPTPLQYALLDKKKAVLLHGMVAPGRRESLSVPAPQKGVYALVMVADGKEGPAAWYGVTVQSQHYAFDATNGTYFMGAPCRIFVAGPKSGNSELAIQTRKDQAYRYNDIQVIGEEHISVDLKEEFNEFLFQKPEEPIEKYYTQDFIISIPNGQFPYIFASPELRLAPR